MNDADDIVKEFLVESYENLDRLDRDLITLEKNPKDSDILASIFRTIHTIKGTSGFLGFGKLGQWRISAKACSAGCGTARLSSTEKSRLRCWPWSMPSGKCWRASRRKVRKGSGTTAR